MDMTKDAVQTIADLGAKTRVPVILHPEREPSHVYMTFSPATGELVRHEAQPLPVQHNAFDLESLVRKAEGAENPEIWYCRDGVVAILDNERRATCELTLCKSAQITKLIELEANAKRVSQSDFVRLLRVTFKGCLPNDALLDSVRAVRWRQSQAGEGKVEHGKSSLGRSVESELSGTKAIPEYVTLAVRVFDSVVIRDFGIECAVEIFAESEAFALTPLPGMVERAIQEAEKDLGGMLGELVEDAVLFFGKP